MSLLTMFLVKMFENVRNCSLFVVRLLKSPQASIYCLSRNIICCIECVCWRHVPMWKILLHRNVLFSWCQLFTIVNTISMDFQHNTKANFVTFIALCIFKYRIAKANLIFWGENAHEHKTKETMATTKNHRTKNSNQRQFTNGWTFEHFILYSEHIFVNICMGLFSILR